MECMHGESANRLPGTIIRVGNRPSQTTRYEFLYIYRLKNISVFENGFLLLESILFVL